MMFPLYKIGKAKIITCLRGILSQYYPKVFQCLPVAVDIYPTFRCNLECIHCDNRKQAIESRELILDTWKAIITDLRKWLGPFILRICGGEPLMRPDIIDIIVFAKSQGVFTVLSTNGTLISRDLSVRIIRSGLDFIAISLDSLRADIHDSLRGTSGSYIKAREAIDLLNGKIGMMQIMTTIMSCNIDEILSLVDFCDDNNIFISFQGLYGFHNSNEHISKGSRKELWPDTKKTNQIFDILLSKKNRSRCIIDAAGYLRGLKAYYLDPQNYMYNVPYRCRAYNRNFRINDVGNVTFCHNSGILGNITMQKPEVIWNSQKAYYARERLRHCPENCCFVRCYYCEGIKDMLNKFIKYLFT